MKFVIFGLSVSSSWGNGHATIWRGLCKGMERKGHEIHFFEHDMPYYASHRDLTEIPGGKLHFYTDWKALIPIARDHLSDADVGMVTSYCPDGISATDLVISSSARLKVFYDLDTPVTLNRLDKGEPVSYIGPRGFRDFDLVLSYTGGKALQELHNRLGARMVAPLYGSVDPEMHRKVPGKACYQADLSYLGTYSDDRQDRLNVFFIEPSRRLPEKKFLIGGSLYPEIFPWTPNIYFVRHVPPPEHPAFYSSSLFTLNVTRRPMAEMGYCPSGRLFEAAACGVPIMSDAWEGLDFFFTPDVEIITIRESQDVVDALSLSIERREEISRAARNRVLNESTADCRVAELESLLNRALQGTSSPEG
ncbi:MAG: CgeB family protein [Candidatus Latescibacterota bacterium]